MAVETLVYPRITPEEYLVRESAAEYRSDYVYGEMRAMAGGTYSHGRLMQNLAGEVHVGLKRKRCEAVSSDVRIVADAEGLFVYPDLTVVCEAPRFLDDKQSLLLNPTVVFEILSPSTEAYDRGLKASRYRSMASLKEYVFISQEEPLVERCSRQPDGLWVIETVRGLNSSVQLKSIGVTLSLAELYDRVEFGDARE